MFGLDSRGEVWIMGLLAQAGWGHPVLLLAAARGTGSPCLHLESVEGVVVQHPALLLGLREGGQSGESKVLVALWGWAAQAEQEVIFSLGRCSLLWPPVTPLLSVPTELLY